MVASYIPPGDQQRKSSLLELIKNHMKSPGAHLIVTGDFNDAASAMKSLAEVYGLHHTERATRKEKALDMVLSDMEVMDEYTRSFARSDHMALHTTLKTRHELHWKHTSVPKRGKVVNDLVSRGIFLTCPEDLRNPLRDLMGKKHFMIQKPRIFIPPEEYVELDREKLKAFHRKY